MKHLLFYACAKGEVSSDAPVSTEVSEICRRLPELLKDSPDFLGVVDPLGVVLQFAKEQDYVWMEIPVAARRGSYGKKVQLSEVAGILEGLGEFWSPTSFSGLEFQAWG